MVVDARLAGIGTRESVADTARVLGRQAAAIVWRTFAQADLSEMAAYAGVPVINALTDDFHPCQILADLLTIREHAGALAGLTLRLHRRRRQQHGQLLPARRCDWPGMHVRIGGPDGFQPDRGDRPSGPTRSPPAPAAAWPSPTRSGDAAAGADVLATDTWVSMGQESEAASTGSRLRPVRRSTADVAGPSATPTPIVLHCLPAYRGKEITAEVIDGPQSRGLGRGGEPPARPEGGPGLPGASSTGAGPPMTHAMLPREPR